MLLFGSFSRDETLLIWRHIDRKPEPIPNSTSLFPCFEALVNLDESGTEFTNVKGIINQGNTCYQNAVIQSLFYCPVFARLLQDLKSPPRSTLWGSLVYFYESPLLHTIPTCLSFSKNRNEQQDAQEYLDFLLNALHEEYMNHNCGSIPLDHYFWSNNKRHIDAQSPVTRIFNGLIQSEIQRPGSVANTEAFQCIHLDCSGVDDSIEASVDRWSRDSVVTINNRNFVRKTKVLVWPTTLVFHLKRFTITNRATNSIKKLTTNMAFDKNLCVDRRTRYNLVALVLHSGKEACRGHYRAIVRMPDDTWLLFDDARTPAVINDVESYQSQVYLLFYNKVL